jgi:hypothetical protein
MKRRIEKGYVSAPRPKSFFLSRKYPFKLLKEGCFISPPYEWAEKDRLRSAVRYWNHKHKACLEISYHPDGWEKSKEPCLRVGWPVGGVHVPQKTRVRSPLEGISATPEV